MAVVVPRSLVTRILAHAQRLPEIEVCGLIGARDGVPHGVYPVANVAATPTERFAMDPKGQIDAMRRMREGGEALFAIYHSHPHAPPAPSARDLAEAAYPEALYLIISLDIAGVLAIAGFRLRDGTAEPVAIEMEEV